VPDPAASIIRLGGVASLAVWLAGVSGALDWVPFSPTENWTALVIGLALLALGGLAGSD
jgi:hypothetical protein